MKIKLKQKVLLLVGATLIPIAFACFFAFHDAYRVKLADLELEKNLSHLNHITVLRNLLKDFIFCTIELQNAEKDYTALYSDFIKTYNNLQSEANYWKNIQDEQIKITEIFSIFSQIDSLNQKIFTLNLQKNPQSFRYLLSQINQKSFLIFNLLSDTNNILLSRLRNVSEVKMKISHRLYVTFFIVALGSLFFISIIGYLFFWSIVKPLKLMHKHADLISAGDYSKRLEIGLKDEIGDLGNAFNLMVENLVQAQEEIRLKNQELEAANEELQAANEEMESTNEELQAANEELEATNDELRVTMEELNDSKNEVMELNLNLQRKVEERTKDLVLANEKLMTSLNNLEKATLELRRSEAKYKNLIETSNDAIYILLEGRFVYVNPKFIEELGYTQEETIADDFTMMKLVAEESKEMILERMRKVSQGEKVPLMYEFTGLAKNGNKVDFEVSVTYIEYQGKPAVQGILRNITQRKLLEKQIELHTQNLEKLVEERSKELKHSEAKLRNLIQNSSDSIIVFSVDGKISVWNQGAAQIYGYEEKDIINKPVSLIFEEKETKDIKKLIQAIKRNEGKYTLEVQRKNKDGEDIYLISTFSLLYDEAGKVMAISCIEKDISLRKKMEKELQDYAENLEIKVEQRTEELKKSEERYRGLFERVRDVVFFSTVDGKFVDLNPAGYELFGFDSNEDVQKT
jgi:PAS domain S-box-containing protein